MTPRDVIPRYWIDLLDEQAPVGVGFDLATTTSKKSNPSSITVAQRDGYRTVERLTVRFRTDREAFSRLMLRTILEDLKAKGCPIRRICLDGTNERFFCERIQKEFSVFAPVDAIVASEKPDPKRYPLAGEGNWKQYLGAGYAALYEDALIAIAPEEWLRKDRRSVLRDKGTFLNTLDEDGNHGDTWDSGKLARHALWRAGRASAEAAPVGGYASAATAPVPGHSPAYRSILDRVQKAFTRRTHV
jgi:hypothetical protein